MTLNSDRIKLVPLTLRQLEESLIDKAKVDENCGHKSNEKSLEESLRKIYKIKIEKITNAPNDYLYFTYWNIVDKNTNEIMGSVGYKGVPNSKGQIEVGYGLNPDYRGHGYMTEALLKIIDWAFSDNENEVKSVIACTVKDNIASQKVLNRINMEKYDEDAEYLWFKLDNSLKFIEDSSR